jgi:DNA excision repair protein ERCC-4
MLVSPAEHHPLLKALGQVSQVTERYGCDFLIFSRALGRIGIQRKTISDLIASLRDGRLQREIGQIQTLDIRVLLLEGNPGWTTDGSLFNGGTSGTWTKAQHYGLMWSIQLLGFWLMQSDTVEDSASLLSMLERWAGKSKHTSLLSRSAPKSIWGKADSKEWQIHIMQGFPGVGYEKAKAIVEGVGGLPFCLRSDVFLTNIKGVGKGIEKAIMEALGE